MRRLGVDQRHVLDWDGRSCVQITEIRGDVICFRRVRGEAYVSQEEEDYMELSSSEFEASRI